MAYDRNNVFARILRGEIPSHKVLEDEFTLAFMDAMPQADGHALSSELSFTIQARDSRPSSQSTVEADDPPWRDTQPTRFTVQRQHVRP